MLQFIIFAVLGSNQVVAVSQINSEEWRHSVTPRTPYCSLKQYSKCNCPNSSFHVTKKWVPDWAEGRKEGHFENAINCLVPNDTICFHGDSLGRQVFIEMACKFGGNHLYSVANPNTSTIHINPISSDLVSGAEMSNIFMNVNHPEYVNPSQKCTAVVLSHGIWYIFPNSNLKTVDEYEISLRKFVEKERATFPQAPIFLKPTLYSSFHVPCYFPEQAPVSGRHRGVEHNESLVVSFNEVLGKISKEIPNVHVIGEDPSRIYKMSKELRCERQEADPVHFCQCNGRPAPLFKTISSILLQQICEMKYRNRNANI
jgi:hypothetical protein